MPGLHPGTVPVLLCSLCEPQASGSGRTADVRIVSPRWFSAPVNSTRCAPRYNAHNELFDSILRDIDAPVFSKWARCALGEAFVSTAYSYVPSAKKSNLLSINSVSRY